MQGSILPELILARPYVAAATGPPPRLGRTASYNPKQIIISRKNYGNVPH